jgi:hypothetical protein
VLVLTHLTGDAIRREAFEKGADAFLDKRDIASGLVPAILGTHASPDGRARDPPEGGKPPSRGCH